MTGRFSQPRRSLKLTRNPYLIPNSFLGRFSFFHNCSVIFGVRDEASGSLKEELVYFLESKAFRNGKNLKDPQQPLLIQQMRKPSPRWVSLWSCHNEIPQVAWLQRHNLFLTVGEAGLLRSRCRQDGFFLWPLSLVCRWPPSLLVVTGLPSMYM